jgi:hypothetical protein
LHIPLPSQRDSTTLLLLALQEAATQTVPLGWNWQLPAPSQKPFCMQVDAASLRQAGRPAGAALPAATGVQWPGFEALLQTWQLPPQPPSQQTLSTQWRLAHSRSPPQISPSFFGAPESPEWASAGASPPSDIVPPVPEVPPPPPLPPTPLVPPPPPPPPVPPSFALCRLEQPETTTTSKPALMICAATMRTKLVDIRRTLPRLREVSAPGGNCCGRQPLLAPRWRQATPYIFGIIDDLVPRAATVPGGAGGG